VEVRILGPLEVEGETGQKVPLGSPKQQALLALLALHPNTVLSTDRIVDALWGEDPPSDGPRNVRVYVSRLREVLEPDRPKRAPGRLIVTEPQGYALRIDAEAIDSHVFERLVGTARRQLDDDPQTAQTTIDHALSLWRDSPLAGLGFEEFAQSEIRRLEELHLAALELGHDASIRVGDYGSVIPELEKLVTDHPTRERFVELLMEALAATGRRTDALRAYRSLELRLGSELGIEPSRQLRRLEEMILVSEEQQQQQEQTHQAEPAPRLPARLTSFVGRQADLDTVNTMLESTRLLTLTGAGGVGKTSLAVEAARREAPNYLDRVWLVDFSPLPDTSGVVTALGDALGVKEKSGVPVRAAVIESLRTQRSLLVLDNCEHVVDAVASLVVELLRSAPELSIMCTSRRSLGVEGEAVYAVEPLQLPSEDADVAELQTVASSHLLAERAAAVSPGFGITADVARDVAALSRRLDGIPLAIELAASNLRGMTIGEVAASLRDRLSLGSQHRRLPHHRTLGATMQWSYDLLAEAEQELFDRLSVFAGPFSRTAALAVGADQDHPSPSPALVSLVAASMLIADVSGRATSYRMLPTMRDFGLSNLRDRGDLERVRRVHAEYAAADAEEMGLRILQAGPTKGIERSVSLQDFRVAADWALQAGLTDLGLDLLVPLFHHLINGGNLAEVEYWHGRVSDLDVEESLALWQLELAVGISYFFTGRNEQAETAFRTLSDAALRIDEMAAWAIAMEMLGRVRWRRGDLRGGRDVMAEGADGAPDQLADTLWLVEGLAVLELYLGNVAAARQRLEVLTAFTTRRKDPLATCILRNVEACLACYEGNPLAAVQAFRACCDTAAIEGDWDHEVNARLGLAWVLPSLDQPNEAVVQAAAVRDLSLETGNKSKEAEALIVMGCAQLDLGDLEQAAQSVADGLDLFRSTVRRVDHMTRGLRFAGWVARSNRDPAAGLRFMVAAEAEHQRMGFVDPPDDAARATRETAEAVAGLSPEERDAIMQAAADATLASVVDEAVDYLRRLALGPS
jgi:predicted ATPase/DNA-binding SARP family transcriptional activator